MHFLFLLLLLPRVLGLSGRFLHITDLHPDEFYSVGAREIDGCHETKKHHKADPKTGLYGRSVGTCDSPTSLINATFDFLDRYISPSDLDFVVWTGDSARHDLPGRPRTMASILKENEEITRLMAHTFKHTPVVPSLGNNDVYPHNIMFAKSKLTKKYLSMWQESIPEVEKHVFLRGGHFSVSLKYHVLISLNTLYWYDHNQAVDSCLKPSKKGKVTPGTEQILWLEQKLLLARSKGKQVIITGHIVPTSWYEDCQSLYTKLMLKYHDIILAQMYGHVNTDYFGVISQDGDLDEKVKSLEDVMWANNGDKASREERRKFVEKLVNGMADESSSTVRRSQIVFDRPSSIDTPFTENIAEGRDSARDDYVKAKEQLATQHNNPESYESRIEILLRDGRDIGILSANSTLGELQNTYQAIPKIEDSTQARHYSIFNANPSVIPTYLPSFRIYHYNVTDKNSLYKPQVDSQLDTSSSLFDGVSLRDCGLFDDESSEALIVDSSETSTFPIHPVRSSSRHFNTSSPSVTNSFLSILGYTQYTLDLDKYNTHPHLTPRYEIAYTTFTPSYFAHHLQDALPPKLANLHLSQINASSMTPSLARNVTPYQMADLTTPSYLDLAHRLSKSKKLWNEFVHRYFASS